eukprot:TRINITY_DN57791_c0_g1_i2.p1 TRINITY_DN57791_c0_g1~~TRINITY_DN57791_c0_g1_i2.p1  ORF type:complete len:151 (-),score=4.69 TRINITY_DN57791_c0_g1_i2:31-483(-)
MGCGVSQYCRVEGESQANKYIGTFETVEVNGRSFKLAIERDLNGQPVKINCQKKLDWAALDNVFPHTTLWYINGLPLPTTDPILLRLSPAYPPYMRKHFADTMKTQFSARSPHGFVDSSSDIKTVLYDKHDPLEGPTYHWHHSHLWTSNS